MPRFPNLAIFVLIFGDTGSKFYAVRHTCNSVRNPATPQMVIIQFDFALSVDKDLELLALAYLWRGQYERYGIFLKCAENPYRQYLHQVHTSQF